MHELDSGQLRKLVEAHREEETECRWCFAIDLHRVKANVIAQHDFPDATVLHLKCPRCGGEFTRYFHAWGEQYLKNIISKLHPELADKIDDKLFNEINDRVWPEFMYT